MQSIPARENGAEVRFVLALDLRVMNAVHSRRDDDLAQKALETNRKSQVTVMKNDFRLKRELIGRECPGRNANETHLDNGEAARERDLAEMKSERGGNVEIGIDMMNVVETPEKRQSMIGEMPVVKCKIHQQKTDRELRPCRERDKVNKTKRPGIGPAQGRLSRRLHQRDCGDEAQGGDHEVDDY